jgi:hypothetical protein
MTEFVWRPRRGIPVRGGVPLFTCKAEELYTTEIYIKKEEYPEPWQFLSYYGNLGIVYQITSNTRTRKL